MRRKLGLLQAHASDETLALDLHRLMQEQTVDFTLCFRCLTEAANGEETPLRALFREPDVLDAWLRRWRQRLAREATSPDRRLDTMRRANPVYIPRNHKVEEALEAAVTRGDYRSLRRLLAVLSDPFRARPGQQAWEDPAPPSFGPYRTFCGT